MRKTVASVLVIFMALFMFTAARAALMRELEKALG